MGRPSLNMIANSADFSADARPSNPVLFEVGNWRLYGHLDDQYSTMAHKCPKWADHGQWNSGEDDWKPEWRWYWGRGACQNCHNTAPEDILAVYTLHNFDRISGMK